MALLANDARERVEQLLIVTGRLTELIGEEARRIEARESPLDGAAAEERNRLANAYRLELGRIKHEPALIATAPSPLLDELRAKTTALNTTLAHHETALAAVKAVTEGLVQAMAEEVTRQRGGANGYGESGMLSRPIGPAPTILDRSA